MTSSVLAMDLGFGFPPGLTLILGALVVPFLRGPVRAVFMLALPVLAFVGLQGIGDGSEWHVGFLGWDLVLARVDAWSLPFAYVFLIAAFLGVLYALHVRDRVQQVACLVYAGSALGAVLAGDLITLFVFWEIVGVSSVFLILARRTASSYAAGMRYILFQILSGVLLLIGIALHANAGGSLTFTRMTEALGQHDPGALLIFLAFGVKCGWPLLHTWFVDAYPESTPTGAVFLSAFTTKLAVYALLRGFPGTESLIWIGTTMALFPIFYAVIENDLRRVLCYSMVNQIGFMVVGIGIGTPLALDGTVAHAFCDIIFKGLLFMSMGAVLLRTGRTQGTDLGGLYRSMPWTTVFCVVGAASVSAFPLFSAFVSKSLIMDAAAEHCHPFVWFALLFASAGVLEHAGIKIPYFAFFAHDSGMRPKEAPRNMLLAMGVSAVLCVVIGCCPRLLYDLLPNGGSGYAPYTGFNILTQLQLLMFGALAVVWLMRSGLYPPELKAVNLDVDWFYRIGTRRLVRFVAGPLMNGFGVLSGFVHERIPSALVFFSRNPPGAMHLLYDRIALASAGLFGSRGAIVRAQARLRRDQARYARTRAATSWPIGVTVLYMSLVFVAVLIVYLAQRGS